MVPWIDDSSPTTVSTCSRAPTEAASAPGGGGGGGGGRLVSVTLASASGERGRPAPGMPGAAGGRSAASAGAAPSASSSRSRLPPLENRDQSYIGYLPETRRRALPARHAASIPERMGAREANGLIQ